MTNKNRLRIHLIISLTSFSFGIVLLLLYKNIIPIYVAYLILPINQLTWYCVLLRPKKVVRYTEDDSDSCRQNSNESH